MCDIMARGLTIKQQRFVKEYIATGNGTQAALKTYDTESEDTASSIAHENLRKPEIVKALDRAGITEELTLQKLKEGLDANKVISANIIFTKPTDPTANSSVANSKTQDFIDVEDWAVRHKYLETALKLRGVLNSKSEDDKGRDVIVIPIYGGSSAVQGHDSNEKDLQSQGEN